MKPFKIIWNQISRKLISQMINQLSPQMLKGAPNGKAKSASSENVAKEDQDALPLRPLRLLNQTNNNGSLT